MNKQTKNVVVCGDIFQNTPVVAKVLMKNIGQKKKRGARRLFIQTKRQIGRWVQSIRMWSTISKHFKI
jgi:hypothetical protein